MQLFRENDDFDNEDDLEFIEVKRRLSTDLKEAAENLSKQEARFLVDSYYQHQKNRVSGNNRVKSMANEPTSLLSLLTGISDNIENVLKKTLGIYALTTEVGQWSMAQCGIGPIISAGLIAHLDIERSPTVGHIWAYAGLDPNRKWIGREKAEKFVNDMNLPSKLTEEDCARVAIKINHTPERFIERVKSLGEKITKSNIIKTVAKPPHNMELKTLCWKIGDSFKKHAQKDKCFYGKIYLARKASEIEKNLNKEFSDQAEKALREKKYKRDTNAKKAYKQGMLPPAHINARAQRYAVKLFLSHWHHVAYKAHFKKDPPRPYIIDHGGHNDYIAPPNY